MPSLAWLLWTACAPAPERAEAVLAACEAPEALQAVREPGCAEALSDDFGVAEGGWAEANGVGREDALAALLSLARAPLGSAEDLAIGGFVHPTWRGWLGRPRAEEAGRPLAHLVYERAAHDVDRVEPVREAEGAFLARWSEGTVGVAVFAAPATPDELAAILLHEARHASGPGHVACADDPERVACDAGFHGSFGFQAAWWGMQVPWLTDPYEAARAEAFAWESAAHVEPR